MRVFPTGDPLYYLARYWLMKQVGSGAWGYPERAYAKWVVLNFVWAQFAPALRGKNALEAFRQSCERKRHELLTPLGRAIDRAFRAALAFYRAKRGKGATALDVSTFFKHKKLDRDFGRFWTSSRTRTGARSASNSRRRRGPSARSRWMIIVTRSEMAEFERFLADLKERLPQPLRDKLGQPHAANELLRELPSLLPPELLAGDTKERRTWEMVGILYLNLGRHQDGIAIFRAMLDQMFKHQAATKSFVHKGVPLVWLADCYAGLGCRALAKRFLMLTLCDDAIAGGGKIDPPDTGVYHRLVWQFGLSHEQVCRYADGMAKLASKDDEHKLFPEAVLLDLDQDWQTEIPTSHESGLFVTNSFYVRHLMNGLGDGAGVALERLAQYVMSCIPGLRVARRARSRSTDYDLVCAMDGAEVDFRSDFGRYFVCECKDWSNPVNFTSFAKFSRVLDSVKARFGVIFSKEGLTGSATTTAAVREQLKVYQDRGLVIVAIDKNDLAELANGKSLIALLRRRYEEVRLDLRET